MDHCHVHHGRLIVRVHVCGLLNKMDMKAAILNLVPCTILVFNIKAIKEEQVVRTPDQVKTVYRTKTNRAPLEHPI
jgi:hypothetical protein